MTPAGNVVEAEAAMLALSTCPGDAAEAVASALVESGLAACVNIVPRVLSVYRWQGQLQRDDEALLLIKTAESRIEALKQRLLALHPYELPEFIAVKVDTGHRAYLEWLLRNSVPSPT